jgi:hypothetical protein
MCDEASKFFRALGARVQVAESVDDAERVIAGDSITAVIVCPSTPRRLGANCRRR